MGREGVRSNPLEISTKQILKKLVTQKPFRSVLWTHLNAAADDVTVVRLELHRHLPETAHLGTHAHRHWQALVYLSGQGTQEVANVHHAVGPGTLVIVPPHVPHAFHRSSRQSPLCLMLDFRAKWPPQTSVKNLAAVEIARIRSLLANLARVADDQRTPDRISRAAAALGLLAAISEASGWHPRPVRHSAVTVLHQVQKALESDPAASPKSLPSALGYHRDHLNRLVREETGLSLGRLAAQIRLHRAQRLLREHSLVRDAAEAAGFIDQNYFARWFKKQTGVTPMAWRASNAARR